MDRKLTKIDFAETGADQLCLMGSNGMCIYYEDNTLVMMASEKCGVQNGQILNFWSKHNYLGSYQYLRQMNIN